MIKVYLIRHSTTEGNLCKRYLGTTDEPLCEEGIALLRGRKYPWGEELYVSPLLRCRQTASLIYPGQEQVVIPGFSECDFGEFENRNYLELSDNPRYQEWIDSGGTLPFPGGESIEGFKTRCLESFALVAEHLLDKGCSSAAFVVHGGTIMSILEACGNPRREYYDWHVKNAGGYLAELRGNSSGICGITLDNIQII